MRKQSSVMVLSVEEAKLLMRIRMLKSVAIMVLIDVEGKPQFISVMSATECLRKKEGR